MRSPSSVATDIQNKNTSVDIALTLIDSLYSVKATYYTRLMQGIVRCV